MATIKDVAKLAGVSVTTVSRILNNRGAISEKTRKKVNNAMKELDYMPNEVARSLLKKRSNIIGVIVPYLDHPFFSRLTESIENACYINGYKMLLCTSGNIPDKEREMVSMLRANKVDGILLCSRIEDASIYAEYELPMVSIERTIENVPSVCCDNYHGGVIAAQTLINGGSKHPLIFSNTVVDYMPARLRYLGFHDECKRSGIQSYEFLIDKEDLFAESFHKNLEKLIKKYPDVDGIFATSDVLAARALLSFLDRGRSAPDDFQIVGFDGIDTSDYFNITTIAQPIKQMGEFSVEMLIKRIDGKMVPNQSILPVTLINRRTTQKQ